MAFGGWIGGVLFDMSGSWAPVIILSTVASITGALILMSMAPTNKTLIGDWEESLPPEARTPTTPLLAPAD